MGIIKLEKMDKEQIEQAANDFAYENWGGGGFEVASSDSFSAGADWRINSVWHDKKEKPVCKGERKFCDIFYISKKGYPHTNTYSEESGFLLYRGEEWRDVKYWAYVEDLLPERKEDAE